MCNASILDSFSKIIGYTQNLSYIHDATHFNMNSFKKKLIKLVITSERKYINFIFSINLYVCL